jgi:hypothetical protein
MTNLIVGSPNFVKAHDNIKMGCLKEMLCQYLDFILVACDRKQVKLWWISEFYNTG